MPPFASSSSVAAARLAGHCSCCILAHPSTAHHISPLLTQLTLSVFCTFLRALLTRPCVATHTYTLRTTNQSAAILTSRCVVFFFYFWCSWWPDRPGASCAGGISLDTDATTPYRPLSCANSACDRYAGSGLRPPRPPINRRQPRAASCRRRRHRRSATIVRPSMRAFVRRRAGHLSLSCYLSDHNCTTR